MELDPEARTSLLVRYKAQLQSEQAAIRERYFIDPDPARYLRQRSQLIDEVLCGLWKELRLPDALALIAVGGYGRGEMWPASDVDLLLLLPGKPDKALTESLELLVGLFWDVGLTIGHSVRTINECLAEAQND